jgi:uridylate kinase
MRIVLRIGGSVVASPVNTNLMVKYNEIVKTLKRQGHEVAVIVGGGALSREFIGIAKKLKLKEQDQDEAAISVSRLFAQLFLKMLGEMGCRKVAVSLAEATECLKKGKILVMGGLKPGMTTDTVAALVAKRVKADLVIKGTDQDGIYSKNPKKHSSAIKLNHLSFDDLGKVLSESKHKAGIHQIIDPEAIKIMQSDRIRLIVVNGFKPENILAAVNGNIVGSLVT